jgi:hypothetical protein
LAYDVGSPVADAYGCDDPAVEARARGGGASGEASASGATWPASVRTRRAAVARDASMPLPACREGRQGRARARACRHDSERGGPPAHAFRLFSPRGRACAAARATHAHATQRLAPPQRACAMASALTTLLRRPATRSPLDAFVRQLVSLTATPLAAPLDAPHAGASCGDSHHGLRARALHAAAAACVTSTLLRETPGGLSQQQIRGAQARAACCALSERLTRILGRSGGARAARALLRHRHRRPGGTLPGGQRVLCAGGAHAAGAAAWLGV